MIIISHSQHTYMKRFFLTLIMLLALFVADAQQKTAKVTLKNGTSLLGTVTELDPLSHVTIIIAGIETRIDMNQVQSIEDIGLLEAKSQPLNLECNSSAVVKGRNIVGSLPRPSYNSDTEGTVVVQVKVDQYGNVTEALAGSEGTTTTDKVLWTAARNAALKAHFNMDTNAPAVQTGTITYIFKVK